MESRARVVESSAQRELVVVATALVGASRLVDAPIAWGVAVLLLGAMLLGTLQVLGEAVPGADSTGIPVEALLTPAVAAVGWVGAIRLVPAGLWLVPALLFVAWLLDRTLATETRLLAAAIGPRRVDRTILLVQAVIVAFVAFAGVAALVPGGLAEPAVGGSGVPGPGGARPLEEGQLVLLAAVDALVAGLLGYRASALRVTNVRDAMWSAATYASAIAIAAAAIRAMVIPRLVGPALLTLVFFLWDAFHGAAPARRRDPRWLWQTVALAVLGIVVVAWNLRLR